MAQTESLGRLIYTIQRNIIMYLDSQFSENGLSSNHIRFLREIHHDYGVNQVTLTAKFGVNKATTARAVAKLVKEGYVIRKRNEADKRAYQIYLTKKGKEIQSKIKDVSNQIIKILLSDFTDDEKVIVLQLLSRMSQNILTKNEKVTFSSFETTLKES